MIILKTHNNYKKKKEKKKRKKERNASLVCDTILTAKMLPVFLEKRTALVFKQFQTLETKAVLFSETSLIKMICETKLMQHL